MKRKIRERSAGCKSSGAPTDRIEHNGTARSKRRANGLAAIGLAGILAAGMGLTGCQNYESSSEMKGQNPVEGGGGVLEPGEPGSRQGPQLVQGEGSADNVSKAETIKLDTERTTAPMPQFEDVSDTVYVKSSDGGSVRIRSACDTGDDSNILTYASPGQR